MKPTYKEILMTLLGKWDFRNKSGDISSEVSTYKHESTWNNPKDLPALELFLSKVKEDINSLFPGHPKKFSFNRGGDLTMRSLQNNRSVIIKPADKDSSVVVWDRLDYFKEAEQQLSHGSTIKKLKLLKKIL